LERSSEQLDKLTIRLRKSFKRYVDSLQFRSFVKKGLNTESLRWWNPFHFYAINQYISQRRYKAEYVAHHGAPIVAVVMMRNVALQDPSAASPALLLGTFDFNHEGLNALDTFVRKLEETKLGLIKDEEFLNYLNDIYMDEDYIEGRRRTVPDKFSDGLNLFFIDSMMRGNDPIENDISRELFGHPLVTLLGEKDRDTTHSEVMPHKISKLTLPILKNKNLPKLVKLPHYVRSQEIILYFILALVISFVLYVYIIRNFVLK
jgi:hypothetical protein